MILNIYIYKAIETIIKNYHKYVINPEIKEIVIKKLNNTSNLFKRQKKEKNDLIY